MMGWRPGEVIKFDVHFLGHEARHKYQARKYAKG